MLLIGTQNIGTQTVLTGGEINIGSVYRKYNRRCSNNSLRTFSTTGTGITLQQEGIYHITATLVGSGDVAGVVTVQLFDNGAPVTPAFSSQTITTVDTEQRTFVIDYYILVDSACILGCNSTIGRTLTLENTGVGATFSSVVVNIDKVV